MSDPAPRSLEMILGLTAFTAGAVDIVSFTQLGGIFASAMTGNLAFLGLYIARGAVFPAIGSFIALLGYIAGTAAAHLRARGRARQPALTRLLGDEVVLLALAAGIGLLVPHRPGGAAADAMIVLLAVAMGLQSIVGKQINLSNIPTVVFTSTLTNIVIGVTETLASGRKFAVARDTWRQLTSFLLYLFGAFCAGLLVYLKVQLVLALPVAAAAAALAVHLTHGQHSANLS